MFSLYSLKPKFQDLLRPTAQKLVNRGITANQITLFTAGASVFLGLILTMFSQVSFLFWLLALWLPIRMALNAIDGMMAREFMQESAQGGYFNEVGDMIADSMLFLPFAFIVPFGGFSIGLLIWVSVMTEVFGLLGKIHGFHGRCYDGFGKSDRALGLFLLACGYAILGGLSYLAGMIVWVMIFASFYTCYLRFQNGLKAL